MISPPSLPCIWRENSLNWYIHLSFPISSQSLFNKRLRIRLKFLPVAVPYTHTTVPIGGPLNDYYVLSPVFTISTLYTPPYSISSTLLLVSSFPSNGGCPLSFVPRFLPSKDVNQPPFYSPKTDYRGFGSYLILQSNRLILPTQRLFKFLTSLQYFITIRFSRIILSYHRNGPSRLTDEA